MSTTRYKTDSEAWMARYLKDHRLAFEYEAPIDGKTPDFSLLNAARQLQAAIDVKDIVFGKVELAKHKKRIYEVLSGRGQGASCEGHDPYRAVRERINVASKQFRGAKHVPCMVVIFDATNHEPLHDPLAVFGAMLGDLQLTFPVMCQPSKAEVKAIFGPNGKMVRPCLNSPQNTRISAVAALRWVKVEQHYSGYVDELKRAYDDLPNLGVRELCGLMLEAGNDIGRKYARLGVDFEREEPHLIIYKNPLAEREWPSSLVGRFDRVWEYKLETDEISLVRDGLDPKAHDF